MAHIFTGNCFATASDMAINYLKCYAVTTGAFVGEWDDLQAVLPGRPQCFAVFIKWSDLGNVGTVFSLRPIQIKVVVIVHQLNNII